MIDYYLLYKFVQREYKAKTKARDKDDNIAAAAAAADDADDGYSHCVVFAG